MPLTREQSRAAALEYKAKNKNNTDPAVQKIIRDIDQAQKNEGYIPEDVSAPVSTPPPTIGQNVEGFVTGALEANNPLSVPRSLEVMARAALKQKKSEVPQESPSGVIVPIPTEPYAVSEEKAKKETILPDLSLQKMIAATAWTPEAGQAYLDRLPKGAVEFGGLIGAILGMGYGAKNVAAGSLVKQAEKATKEVASNVKFLTGIKEGPVMDAILQRANQVKSLLESKNLSPDSMALELAKNLKNIQKTTGQAVGTFRELAQSDPNPSINVSKALQRLNLVEKESSTTGGASALTQADRAQIDKIRSLFPVQTTKGGALISPKDALLVTDTIDSMPLYSKDSNLHVAVSKALSDVRAMIKDAARTSSGSGAAWAKADSNFKEFKELSDGLIDKFEGDQRVSAINNLLNDPKEPLRLRLNQTLDLLSGNKSPKPSEVFMNKLADLKAAQNLRDVEVPSDRTADQLNRIFERWKVKGETIGSTALGGTGAVVGGFLMPHYLPVVPGGMSGAFAGGVAGAYVGKKIGGLAGALIGKKLGSPEAILNAASKAKILSDDARNLASDLGFVQKHFGVEGANIFWHSVQGGIPAVNELAHFVERRENPELGTFNEK